MSKEGVYLSFDDFRTSGLLWYINKHLFHDMGFALAVETDEDNKVTQFLLLGDGEEKWEFTPEVNEQMGPIVAQLFAHVREVNEDARARTEVRDLSSQEEGEAN